MSLDKKQLMGLLNKATQAAQSAAAHIRQFDRGTLMVNKKSGGESLSSQVVTQVDLECQDIILEILASVTEEFGFAVLSEENADEASARLHDRHQLDFFWCIDPLDGTLPFIEGVEGYAVSIALVAKNGEPLLGVVVNPVNGDCFQAYQYSSVTYLGKNNQAWLPIQSDLSNQTLHLFFDRSFLNDSRFDALYTELVQYAKANDLDKVEVHANLGAVMNAMNVLQHPKACYIKLPKVSKGGGCLWDFAATSAITIAASFIDHPITSMVSDIEGQPLDLNRIDSNFMNHKGVLYSNGIEHDAILKVCKKAMMQ